MFMFEARLESALACSFPYELRSALAMLHTTIRRTGVLTFFLRLVVGTAATQLTAEVRAGCPGSGDCCSIHAGFGCDDFNCCDEVCSAEPFCCFLDWDGYCVSLAEEACGNLCGGVCPGIGDCCTSHATPGCNDGLCCDLVCTENFACCAGTWSSTCANLAVAICDVCEPPIVCPMEGDCCDFNFTGGCDREFCCDLICNVLDGGDEFCCRGKWDDICARKAREHCANICECEAFGDLNGDGLHDLRDVAANQNCFGGQGAAIGDECACADYDSDDDADLADFRAFQSSLGQR